MIKNISIDEVKALGQNEGLVLQGCGGDLNKWVAGINDTLTTEGILQNGSTFSNVYAFSHNDCTNLLFMMDEDVELDAGRLAMWRLTTHANFGGTWLSDYLPNKLGYTPQDHVQEAAAKPETVKPQCPLIGADGNVFSLIGLASRTLKRSGMADAAKEMSTRVTSSGSYQEALAIIMEYVEPVDPEEMHMDEPEM